MSAPSTRLPVWCGVPRPHKGAGRRVYPGFLQALAFVGLAPERHISAFSGLAADVARGTDEAATRTREFYEEYFSVLDATAEFYLDTARIVSRDHDLARGGLRWRARSVNPAAISTALLTIEAENDELCPPGQTRAAQALCTGIPAERKRHHLQPGSATMASSAERDSSARSARSFVSSSPRMTRQRSAAEPPPRSGSTNPAFRVQRPHRRPGPATASPCQRPQTRRHRCEPNRTVQEPSASVRGTSKVGLCRQALGSLATLPWRRACCDRTRQATASSRNCALIGAWPTDLRKGRRVARGARRPPDRSPSTGARCAA